MTEYIVELDGMHSIALRLALAEEMRGGDFIRGEIVRCRDCKHASAGEAVVGGNWQMGNCHNPRFRGSLHAANVRADGFCAWGERKKVSE